MRNKIGEIVFYVMKMNYGGIWRDLESARVYLLEITSTTLIIKLRYLARIILVITKSLFLP
jgi:hypothetical protein